MRSIAGLAAAQQQDWKLAIRYFLDAQKIDPDASQVWFNLGLASSKLPDHEFRAIAWFKDARTLRSLTAQGRQDRTQRTRAVRVA
jgi:hypothetical protein